MKLSFELTQENEMWRQKAQEYAEKVAAPKAAEVDQSGRFSREVFKAIKDYGLLGVSFPKEYGGSGGDDLCRSLVIEEVAKQCAATAINISVTQLAPYCILQYGSEEQKKKYVPRILAGQVPAAFALTEPNAASDASMLEATARLDGDNYIINGSKYFITNGAMSELTVMFARSEAAKGVKGISAFIVEKGMPGFKYGRRFDKMGIGGSQAIEQVYNNVPVPRENMLGKPGQGFSIAMTALDAGRIGISSMALGIAERALSESVLRMHDRKQFGRPIADFDGMRWYVAEMKTRVEAARNLIWKAIWLKSTGQDFSLEVAMAKLFATETARICSERAVQIHGAYGYIKDYVVERLYRDAKGTEIYEGTSEIQKLIISRKVLGR